MTAETGFARAVPPPPLAQGREKSLRGGLRQGSGRNLWGASGAVDRTCSSEASDGEGFDLVFDATGNRASMEGAFGYVAHGGMLVLVSVVIENISFSDPEFHKREMTVIGSRNALKADFEHVIAAIDGGRVPLVRLLTHRTNLARVTIDLPHWAANKQGLVKALLEIA
jgi:threonine dehydrogenase-like Zn-dependent dehydrogenase